MAHLGIGHSEANLVMHHGVETPKWPKVNVYTSIHVFPLGFIQG